MKILHTADLHLGRQFSGIDLQEDFDTVLLQIIEALVSTRADVLLIAGDIFDRASPPAASSARTHSTRPNCGACGVDCIAGEAWWKRRAHLRSQVQSGRLCDVVGFVWVSATGTRRIRGEVG